MDIGIQTYFRLLFEVDIYLLAFANFAGGSVKKGEYGGQMFGMHAAQVIVGLNHHNISGQQGSIIAIFFMHGFVPSAQGGFIHNIVVNQGKIVKQFNRSGYLPGIGRNIAE